MKQKKIFVLMVWNVPKLMPETQPQMQVAQIQEYINCRYINQINIEKTAKHLWFIVHPVYKKLRSCHSVLRTSKILN